MNRFINSKNLLIGILALAAFLRLWKLGTIPPSLAPDEAALGYNAYSILKTGKDEYGQILPVIFKSFGDYKPGLYVYLTVPFVTIFGLNEWSVRLPSAMFGIISVYLIYLIVKKLTSITGNRKAPSETGNLKSITNSSGIMEILAAFIAAVNPWLIYFSRGAWEANISLTLTLFGIYFFLKASEKSRYFINSALFFSLTLWAYQGAKLASSLVVFVLIITFWKRIKDIWKLSKVLLLASLVIGFLISLPVIFSFFEGKTGRLVVFSIFSYPRHKEYIQSFLDEGNESLKGVNYYLFHSESFNFARGIAGRWFNHFGGRFLFFEGDYQNARHGSPYQGVMLLVDMILIPIGILYLIRNYSKLSTIFLLWLVLAPLPSVLSRNEVHAVRSLNMSVPLIIISAAGLYYLIILIKRLNFRPYLFSVIFLSYVLSIFYFLDSYFVHVPVHNAKAWYFGYKEVIETIAPVRANFERIIFQQSYAQPYIYYLFYTKYDPKKYQEQASINISGEDVGLVNKVDNITFESYSWEPALDKRKTLIIGDDIAIPADFSRENFNLISEIKLPDRNSTAFRILEKK